jgi:hypothetical protein
MLGDAAPCGPADRSPAATHPENDRLARRRCPAVRT